MNLTSARGMWWGVVLLATLAYPQSEGPVFPDPGDAHMSREQQRTLGLNAAAQVYQQMPVLPDTSPETQYIRQLGQKLVATIPTQYTWPYEFHVVAQKDINAFALPGGPMFVNVGTIIAAADEAQLAGVMAHEMSHVYMQHSAKQEHKAQLTSSLAGLAGGVLGAVTGGGMMDQLAQAGIQFGAQGLMLKYSRSDESQADHVGAIILYKAGYNPQALADFFKTLEAQGGAPPQFLSDHPSPGNRELAIEKEIKDWPPENYLADSPAFQKVRQHATGVKSYTAEQIAEGAKTGRWAGHNNQNGAAFSSSGPETAATAVSARAPTAAVSLQSVAPSQQMVGTQLGPLQMTRPQNWPVTPPQHGADYVTIAPAAGVTPNGVGYGVLVNAAKTNGQPVSLETITTELVQQLQRSHGARAVSNAQLIDVNGVPGRSVMMQSISPFPSADGQQQLETDWLVTTPQSDDVVLFFVFIAPQSDFARFRPTYEAMLKSVQF